MTVLAAWIGHPFIATLDRQYHKKPNSFYGAAISSQLLSTALISTFCSAVHAPFTGKRGDLAQFVRLVGYAHTSLMQALLC